MRILDQDAQVAAREDLKRWAAEHDLTIDQIKAIMATEAEAWPPLQTIHVNNLTDPAKLEELRAEWEGMITRPVPTRFKLVFKQPGEVVEHEIEGNRYTALDLGDLLIFTTDVTIRMEDWYRLRAFLPDRNVIVIPKNSEVYAVEVPDGIVGDRAPAE